MKISLILMEVDIVVQIKQMFTLISGLTGIRMVTGRILMSMYGGNLITLHRNGRVNIAVVGYQRHL